MATDQALLDLAEQRGAAVLRLYQWEPHCLSLGRNEPALRRYDRDRIASLGLDVVRRPTGGRAVWHARELTYSVAAPVERFGSLGEAYRQIHEMLAAALRRLGAEATLARTPSRLPGLGAGACFAYPVGGEVIIGGHKVVGSAQVRQGTAFLQHGSLLLEDDQRLIAGISRGPAAPSGEAPLSDLLGRRITFADMRASIAETSAGWNAGWNSVSDLPGLEAAASGHADRFRSAEWTWRR
jgi:lipoate-protein ligase A